jgi:hypothetical protein
MRPRAERHRIIDENFHDYVLLSVLRLPLERIVRLIKRRAFFCHYHSVLPLGSFERGEATSELRMVFYRGRGGGARRVSVRRGRGAFRGSKDDGPGLGLIYLEARRPLGDK